MLPFQLPALSLHKGKLAGAVLGLLVAGFWGLVVGFAAGLAYDQWKHYMLQVKKRPSSVTALPFLSSRTALVLSVVAYARAIALPRLSDSRRALEILKKHFLVDADTLRYVGKILVTDAPQLSDVPAQLHQLKEACRLQANLRAEIVLSLLDLAADDTRQVDQVSLRAIHEAARILSVPEDEWRGLIAHYAVGREIDDPYAVIGVAPQAGADDVSRAYRELMRSHHPDVHVGADNHFTRARLQERAARINAAYEKLKRSRA